MAGGERRGEAVAESGAAGKRAAGHGRELPAGVEGPRAALGSSDLRRGGPGGGRAYGHHQPRAGGPRGAFRRTRERPDPRGRVSGATAPGGPADTRSVLPRPALPTGAESHDRAFPGTTPDRCRVANPRRVRRGRLGAWWRRAREDLKAG